jgi:xanthine dehydrogenase large subunit
MKNVDSKSHVRGESVYLDDIPLLQERSFRLRLRFARCARKVEKRVVSEAEKSAGVVRIITAKDLIGENEIGGILPDEPLFADEEVHFQGMPIALVLAETEEQAHHAAKLIERRIEPLEIVTDPRVPSRKTI